MNHGNKRLIRSPITIKNFNLRNPYMLDVIFPELSDLIPHQLLHHLVLNLK